jgi:hypothetical protein
LPPLKRISERLHCAAQCGDLFLRALGELMRVNGQFLGQFAVAEDLDRVLDRAGDALFDQQFRGDNRAVLETLQDTQVDDGVIDGRFWPALAPLVPRNCGRRRWVGV